MAINERDCKELENMCNEQRDYSNTMTFVPGRPTHLIAYQRASNEFQQGFTIKNYWEKIKTYFSRSRKS
jgi:hypothetical protein